MAPDTTGVIAAPKEINKEITPNFAPNSFSPKRAAVKNEGVTVIAVAPKPDSKV